MVEGVSELGMEACATLGMLTDDQAEKLATAGLTAYNHNLDTSRDHYKRIISTRSYDDRLETLDRVAKAGISVCCGGIIGMGESADDRCAMLCELAHMRPHPGSVPINALVAVSGTPLAEQRRVEAFELVRMIAVARIMMPASMVRLSAGREGLSPEAQLLCFMAGANSIFYGDKLLTTGNPDVEADQALFREAGLKPIQARVDAQDHIASDGSRAGCSEGCAHVVAE
jgi:biotin synthase